MLVNLRWHCLYTVYIIFNGKCLPLFLSQFSHKSVSPWDFIMGRIFLDHIGGTRLFSCANCDTILTNRSELISTRFTGATGRAFLFNKVWKNFIPFNSALISNQTGNLFNVWSPASKCAYMPVSPLQVVNLQYSEVQDRVMLTGRHMVRDVSCKNCNSKLGWIYEFATEDSQRYKEGRVILERALVRESEGFEEHVPSDNSWALGLISYSLASTLHTPPEDLVVSEVLASPRHTPSPSLVYDLRLLLIRRLYCWLCSCWISTPRIHPDLCVIEKHPKTAGDTWGVVTSLV